MNCIGPTTPDDAELLAYADDEASFAVREHVARCAACQLRAHALSHEARSLQNLLHRAGCPTALDLGEFHLHLLGEQRAAKITQHLTYCLECRYEIADLAAFMARTRRPVAGRAQELFGSLRTIVAQLSAGPLAAATGVPAPVVRGVSDAAAPLVYTAEDVLVTVDSWIERAGQPGRLVAGLVVGPVDFSGARASIDAAATASSSPVDKLGNFLFSAVSPGVHHLMIEFPAAGIQIEIAELLVR